MSIVEARLRALPALAGAVLLVLAAAACSHTSDSSPISPAASCEIAAGDAVEACVRAVGFTTKNCYLATGSACADGDRDIGAQLAAAVAKIDDGCADDQAVRDAGYGPLFTKQSLADRVTSACVAEVRALAARSFGGPQGAAFAKADEAGRSCLGEAARIGVDLLAGATGVRNECLADERRGGACDAQAAASDIAQGTAQLAAGIDDACTDLSKLVALDTNAFLARAEQGSQCLTAIAHPDAAPLDVACGPRDDVPALPRGRWTQVVLDEAKFGTRCGNGSPYAFQVWLPPEGQPVENVVVGMQGGGVCVFESDCASRDPDLYEALMDQPEDAGPLSTDPALSPFASWTKVYLPYCTQDVFIGGGATSNFPSITVERFGAIDVRAALRYVRDLIWRELDRDSARGYDSERMRVLFGGFSAGGFGTLYNYHYVLDELQWRHSAAYPDAALALDNGQALGVRGLGAIAGSTTPPLGWGALSQLPPYCFATDCGVGPVLLAATAPRLLEVPEQRFLVLSNQVDQAQVETTYFPDLVSWIDAMRKAYCETRGLNGVDYFLPPVAQSTHVISTRPEFYAQIPVDGVYLRDWLSRGISGDPSLVSQVEEGGLVAAYPGVEPFSCDVAQ